MGDSITHVNRNEVTGGLDHYTLLLKQAESEARKNAKAVDLAQRIINAVPLVLFNVHLTFHAPAGKEPPPLAWLVDSTSVDSTLVDSTCACVQCALGGAKVELCSFCLRSSFHALSSPILVAFTTAFFKTPLPLLSVTSLPCIVLSFFRSFLSLPCFLMSFSFVLRVLLSSIPSVCLPSPPSPQKKNRTASAFTRN